MIGKVEFKQEGEVILYTSTSATTKDTPIYVNGFGVMIPQASAGANVQNAYRRCGLYRIAPANSIAVTVGALVFYDSAAGRAVLTRPTSGFLLGVAVTAGTGTTAGTVTVDVLINTVDGGNGNFQGADVYAGRLLEQYSVASIADSAVTLTAAQVKNGIVSQTPGAARAITLPAAADLLAICPRAVVGSSFELTIINLAANTHVQTLTASGTFTVVGLATVQPATSATFRVVFSDVSTAACVAYRI